MARTRKRGCYILELSVMPGGMRRSDFCAYNDFAYVEGCLRQELLSTDPERLWYTLLCFLYGETAAVWTVQRGEAVSAVDLHDHVRVRIGDAPPLPLAEVVARGDDHEAWQTATDPEGEVRAPIAFEVDWAAIRAGIAPLEERLLWHYDSVVPTVGEELLRRFPQTHLVAGGFPIGYGPQGFEDDDIDARFVDPDQRDDDELDPEELDAADSE